MIPWNVSGTRSRSVNRALTRSVGFSWAGPWAWSRARVSGSSRVMSYTRRYSGLYLAYASGPEDRATSEAGP